jgi:uncharacterized protein (TIGR00251 family)
MWLEEKEGYLYIHVKVQPRSSKNEMVGIHGESLKIKLTSPPVEGAANSLLVEFMAKRLGVPKSNIEIVSGGKSRRKTLKIEGMSKAEVSSILGISP